MALILIVDDDSVDRELAERCLEDMDDVEILHAGDGAEALTILADKRPDLVLTDLRMPGLDGLELVRKAKQQFPLTPVVLMTSKGSERDAVQALAAGAASYVPKSVLQQELEETVEQVLELAEESRSKYEVLNYLEGRETRFVLANDLRLIAPLVNYFTDQLEGLGMRDETGRTRVGVALLESMSNAIIHGNLEVSSEIRDEDPAAYYRLIEERRQIQPYAARRVRCTVRESTERIDFTIEDEGPGFDFRSLPDPTDPENVAKVRGRGLMLIRTFMDRVVFNERGNCITMTKQLVGGG